MTTSPIGVEYSLDRYSTSNPLLTLRFTHMITYILLCVYKRRQYKAPLRKYIYYHLNIQLSCRPFLLSCHFKLLTRHIFIHLIYFFSSLFSFLSSAGFFGSASFFDFFSTLPNETFFRFSSLVCILAASIID